MFVALKTNVAARDEVKKKCPGGYDLCGFKDANNDGTCFNPGTQYCCDGIISSGGPDRKCCGEKTCASNEGCCAVLDKNPETGYIEEMPACYDTEKFICYYHTAPNRNPWHSLDPKGY